MEAILFVFCVILVISLVVMGVANNEHKRKLQEVKEVLGHKEEFIKNELQILEANGEYFVDGDSKPLKIEGYTATVHHRNGFWRFNQENLKFLNGEAGVAGQEIYQLVENVAFNANLIDFLLTRQKLIPDNWPKTVFCFGTIYSRNNDGFLFVRGLIKCEDGEYSACLCPLRNGFRPNNVLILKK